MIDPDDESMDGYLGAPASAHDFALRKAQQTPPTPAASHGGKEGFAAQMWGLSILAQAKLDNGDPEGALKTLVRIVEVAAEECDKAEIPSPSPLPCGEEELARALFLADCTLANPEEAWADFSTSGEPYEGIYVGEYRDQAKVILSHLSKATVDAAGPRDTSAIGCADEGETA